MREGGLSMILKIVGGLAFLALVVWIYCTA